MMRWLEQRRKRDREELERIIRESVRAESDRLQRSVLDLQDSLRSTQNTLADVRSERDRYKAHVREQNEADVALVSLRIIMKAIGGERDAELERRQAHLQAEMARNYAMQNAAIYAPASPLSALSGLGSLLLGSQTQGRVS